LTDKQAQIQPMSDEQAPQTYRLMTYNLGGGHGDLSAAAQVVREAQPDILALQEAIRVQDVDGRWRSDLDAIAQAFVEPRYAHYEPTLTLAEHLDVTKRPMAQAVFADNLDWQHGNALVSRWPFHRLGNRTVPGTPRMVPLFRPAVYQGDRDTDPRAALIGRVGRAPLYPLVIGLHLTTLVGERGERVIAGKPEQAAAMREEQTRRLLTLLKDHALARGEIVFILGDFNAPITEPAIRAVLLGEGGFMALRPQNDLGTHAGLRQPIDHILVYPRARVADVRCQVIDSPLAYRASDHLPVLAEVKIA
jgi:endonuclease/exonuclease/phosphatase family metal-dependent hydrolase